MSEIIILVNRIESTRLFYAQLGNIPAITIDITPLAAIEKLMNSDDPAIKKRLNSLKHAHGVDEAVKQL